MPTGGQGSWLLRLVLESSEGHIGLGVRRWLVGEGSAVLGPGSRTASVFG